jgi:hypothetical protein
MRHCYLVDDDGRPTCDAGCLGHGESFEGLLYVFPFIFCYVSYFVVFWFTILSSFFFIWNQVYAVFPYVLSEPHSKAICAELA